MKQLWMRTVYLALLILPCLWLATGCSPSTPTGTGTSPAAGGAPLLPTGAQPRLQTINLWIGAQVMSTELALTEEQEMTGMMFRTNMGPNEGMLFVFPQPVQASFWMKNTIVPLTAAYIAPDGTILELHDLKPQDTNAVVAATANIQYVLEAPQGWFAKNNINTGVVIRAETGQLHEIFFRK